MTINNLLSEFENNKSLSIDSIKYIQTNTEIGKELITYFKKNKNRDFALCLIDKFIKIRKEPYPNGYEMGIETLMFSAYLLGLHQNIEDSLKIWNTKTIDFDTFCGFDIQLVVFAGVEKTIEYLKANKNDDAQDALKYIEECKKCGDFDEIESYHSENELPWFI